MSEKNFKKSDEPEGEKILVSFYLSQKSSEQVDDILFYIKKRLPFEKRRKLTKSTFYELGLKLIIEDYNKKGEESPLWKAIQKLLGN
jgi:hypothetical protein